MNKRIKGLKDHPTDIAKSIVKRAFKIGQADAKLRLAICKTCPSSVKDEVFGGTMCNECWCNHSTLVYSTGKGCELNKW